MTTNGQLQRYLAAVWNYLGVDRFTTFEQTEDDVFTQSRWAVGIWPICCVSADKQAYAGICRHMVVHPTEGKCPKWFNETLYQPTSNGILSGIPKITETKNHNRINQLGHIDGGGGGI